MVLEKYTKDEAKSIRIGLITMLAIIVAVFITISHNTSIKGAEDGSTYTIYANFGRTDGLNEGDAVRMSGVSIGRVVESSLDENFNSKLSLEINSKYKSSMPIIKLINDTEEYLKKNPDKQDEELIKIELVEELIYLNEISLPDEA